MFSFLKSIFSPNPLKKIRKLRDQKYKEAVAFQRNGKLKQYASVMKEIEALEDSYVKLSIGEDDG